MGFFKSKSLRVQQKKRSFLMEKEQSSFLRIWVQEQLRDYDNLCGWCYPPENN